MIRAGVFVSLAILLLLIPTPASVRHVPNISLDPLFCDPDNAGFTLAENSPCAHANTIAGCGRIGALGVGCGFLSVEGEEAAPPLRGRTLSAVPDPFNPSTPVAYGLAAPARVCLRIFAPSGRLVKSLVDEVQRAGVASP